MATIRECIGEEVKIGKTSITIKNKETNKTKGIVKNVVKFKDLQPNKQSTYFKRLRELNIWGNKFVNMDKVVIHEDDIVVFRNMKSVDFHNKYGFVDDTEKENFEKQNEFYDNLATEVEVINCYC